MKKLPWMMLLLTGCLVVPARGGPPPPAPFRPPVAPFFGGYPFAYSFYSPGIASTFSYSPAYGYDYPCRPNYAVNATSLGALMGGIIGESIHHQGWEGAGIGAAAGLLLGGIAEHATRSQERAMYQSQYAPSVPTYQNSSQQQLMRAPEPAAVPAWNPPIRATNATYYWSAPPALTYKIPDASRVPDAPPIQNPGTNSKPAAQ
jgi:hypothetical protein